MEPRERAERARYKRLIISFHDLEDSRAYLARLIGLNGQTRIPAEERHIRSGLETALVVSYARPFSGNRAAEDVHSSLPTGFLKALSPVQLQTHNELIQLRDQQFAHSDPGPAEVQVWVTEPAPGVIIASPLSSVTRVPLMDEFLEIVATLQEHLHACIYDEMMTLQASFRPGERF